MKPTTPVIILLVLSILVAGCQKNKPHSASLADRVAVLEAAILDTNVIIDSATGLPIPSGVLSLDPTTGLLMKASSLADRVFALEQKQERLSRLETITSAQAENAFHLGQSISTLQDLYKQKNAEDIARLDGRIDALYTWAKQFSPPTTTRNQTQTQDPRAYKDGIPASVYSDIAAQAVKDWPGDYRMQIHVIEQQVEAYKKLHP